MERDLAVIAVLAVIPIAGATIAADHVLWDSGTLPESGDEFFTVRLQVHVTTTPGHTEGDDWMAAKLFAYLDGGVFYEHSYAGDPPNPALFSVFPDMEYDSYFTSPADYPNADYDGAVIGVAPGWGLPWVLDTAWFDTADSGNGDFVIAQFTVLPREPDWEVTGLLEYTAADTVVLPSEYAFTIPEPGMAALWASGALLAARRRR